MADNGQTGAIYFMMSEAGLASGDARLHSSASAPTAARAPLMARSRARKSHPRGWGSYPRILGKLCARGKVVDAREGDPKNDGHAGHEVWVCATAVSCAKAMFADIAIFDPRRVIDRATFEAPNQYPDGIKYVIVNGQLSVDDGKRTAALAGRPLRGPGYGK